MKKVSKTSSRHSTIAVVLVLAGIIIVVTTIALIIPRFFRNAIASSGHIDSRLASLTLGTKPATEVPSVLPQGGITINNQFVLRPLVALPKTTTTISANQAVLIGRKYANAQPFPATTLLTSFTSINSVPPPGVTAPSHIIQNVATWVITFTSNNPQNVAQGKPSSPPVTLTPKHLSIVINASTGAFVLGFFTV